MKDFFILTAVLFLLSCNPENSNKIPVYAWESGPGNKSDTELLSEFKELKEKGIDGLMYNAGHSPETNQRVAKLAKEAGLEYHAWIPALKQFRYDLITNLVNRLAERILQKQADYSCSFSRAKFCGKKNSQAGMG
jgi:diphthamide synthase (EF-2-diphthine--ammonia ligase)